MTKLFFATDVHGSEICWKKFISAGKFYEVDVIILGGDMTGKAIVPIIAQGNDQFKVTLLEQETILDGQDEVDQMVKTIQNRGYYPYVTDPDEVAVISATPGRSDELFLDQALNTVQRWIEYADAKLEDSGIRCYVCPGNDDVFEIDEVIAASKSVELAGGKVIPLDDHHEMASCGWSNPTPWDTHREEDEDALRRRLKDVTSQLRNPRNAVFNFHAPPHGSGLDEAPELTENLELTYAGRVLINVGSHAVFEAIEEFQPLLGLHGHIHEGKGTRKIRRTLCINPGSMYEQGMLQGATIELKRGQVRNYLLTAG